MVTYYYRWRFPAGSQEVMSLTFDWFVDKLEKQGGIFIEHFFVDESGGYITIEIRYKADKQIL